MLYISPYIIGSKSARELARLLNVKQIKGHKIMPRNTLIVNWGKDNLDPRHRGRMIILNSSESVAIAKDKIKTLQVLKDSGVSVPDFTKNKAVAQRWMNEDKILYGRHSTNSQQGRGIEIIKADSDRFPSCPLYTLGIIKAYEYRVHVFRGKIISYAQKKRRSDTEANPYIKNSDNGWVFCRDGVELPESVAQESIKAVKAIGLDFGAVDVLCKKGQPYVLEINTAPGIEGTTLQDYAKAIKETYASYFFR